MPISNSQGQAILTNPEVIAVYNLGGSPANITVPWTDFGGSGVQRVRDQRSRARVKVDQTELA